MEARGVGNSLKRGAIIGGIVLILIVAAAITMGILWSEFLIDIWWYHSLGYELYFWQRKLYAYMVFLAAIVFFFGIFFLNFWIAARFLKKNAGPVREGPRKLTRKIMHAFHTGSLMAYTPFSFFLSLPIAISAYYYWESFLFYIFGPVMEVSDPIYGKDISFYLFSYPIYTLLQRRLLIVFLILFIGLLLLYMVKNRLRYGSAFSFHPGAKWHLGILILCIIGIELWDFMLQRYSLVYNSSHTPLFYGPGYVEMHVILPFIWGAMVFLSATAVMVVVVLRFRMGYKTLVGCIALLCLSLAGIDTTYLTRLVQTYIVKPNELDLERPYIERNIQSTLNAYNLNNVEIRDFNRERFPLKKTSAEVQNVLRNIPVWDSDILDNVFRQLQELRTYYTFPMISVGRYTVADTYQQVFLSAREINYDNLPLSAKNWINEHLIYTHGFGLVMTPASQVGGQPMTWFINNIPPVSEYGLPIGETRIYYGIGKFPYAIAPNEDGEMDFPKNSGNELNAYKGTGGVPISSLFRKLIFALHLKEKNLFFSAKLRSDSKILLNRNILDRIRTIAPFLMLDRSPYVVSTPKGIYWIVDAYTTSSRYPAAAPYVARGVWLNYIRNSVKIAVNAYTGQVDFYIFDQKDPIIETYRRIYPELFKGKESMPDDLKPHIRYPKDLFDIQMNLYANYHQTNPTVFYQQEDRWVFDEPFRDEIGAPLTPYYLTLDLITPGVLDFLLLEPMYPKGRDNLRSLAIVGCDGDNYGRIIMYNFPKGELVYGPAQIDAMINQDPDIAQQFTLWDQAGSSVVKGKMIILTLNNSVLFIQPVYLKSTSRVAIPELQRIIMSEGQVAVMKNSLEDAYEALRIRIQEEVEGMEKRFPIPPVPPPDQGTGTKSSEGGNAGLQDSSGEMAP
jgi:uncharacterized protein